MEQTLVIRRRASRGAFGRYALLRPIGRGGMGEVWLAQREGASEPCVLKRLTEALAQHPVAGKRFQREAHVAAFLDHPGVAKTLDAGFVDDAFYIAMEHVAGVDLAAILGELSRRGAVMPVEIAVTIALKALDALAYVHDARGPDGAPLEIVHRDLAPKNLMLTFDGRVKVIDFGVARAALGDFETANQVLVGTVEYFAPEQAFAQRVDRRSDLYAMGAVLFELLTATALVPPMPVGEALATITQQRAPPPSSRRAQVTPALDRVVLRALEKAPEDRYPDAVAFAAALRATGVEPVDEAVIGAWLERHFPAQAAAIVEPPREASEATLAAFAAPPPPPAPARSKPIALVAALLVAVGLLSIAVFARGPQATTDASPVARATPNAVAPSTAPRATARARGAGGDATDEIRSAERDRTGERARRRRSRERSEVRAAYPRAGQRAEDERTDERAANQRADNARDERAPREEGRAGALDRDPKRSRTDRDDAPLEPTATPRTEALRTALAARRLSFEDLAHQHHVPGATRVATAKRDAAREAASARVYPRVQEIEFARWRLRRRVTELQAKLEAANDASNDSELIDLRVQLAGDEALAPKVYNRLCKTLDDLER